MGAAYCVYSVQLCGADIKYSFNFPLHIIIFQYLPLFCLHTSKKSPHIDHSITLNPQSVSYLKIYIRCNIFGSVVEIANLATKPTSRDDDLVAILAISTNMLHKPDLSTARSGTIVFPRAPDHNF